MPKQLCSWAGAYSAMLHHCTVDGFSLNSIKLAEISEAPVHIFIVQTGAQRINLSTIDVWQLGV